MERTSRHKMTSSTSPLMIRYATPCDPIEADGVVFDALVCDNSGSMEQQSFEDGKTKRLTVREAILGFLASKRQHRPQDYVSIVAFHHSATVCCGFLNVDTDCSKLHTAVEMMAKVPTGGTEMRTGLQKAFKLIRSVDEYIPAHNAMARILAYSDGYDFAERKALRLARKLKARDVMIETFGVGRDRTDVDEAFLREVATTIDDFTHYRFLGDATAVRQTFSDVATGFLTFED